MMLEDFDKLRHTVKYGSYTPWQLCLLLGDLIRHIAMREEFALILDELQEIEEVAIEALDTYEGKQPYQPDPADLVTLED